MVFNSGESFLVAFEAEDDDPKAVYGEQLWTILQPFLQEDEHDVAPLKNERWSAHIVRIGNQAVRQAQARNRQLGIPNWYSLNGRLVSDAAEPAVLPPADKPEPIPKTAG